MVLLDMPASKGLWGIASTLLKVLNEMRRVGKIKSKCDFTNGFVSVQQMPFSLEQNLISEQFTGRAT